MTSAVEKHDILMTPYALQGPGQVEAGVSVTCSCGTVIAEFFNEIITLDEIVDASWRHLD